MNIGLVAVGVLAIGCFIRVIFLNSEIKVLAKACAKFLAIAESGSTIPAGQQIPIEVEEAKTEYEWLKHTTDLKKESRLIWIAGGLTLLFVFVLALII